MSLQQISREKAQIIRNADSQFSEQMKRVEDRLVKTIKQKLSQFEMANGKLSTRSKTNTELLARMQSITKRALNESKYYDYVKNYLGNFDKIADLNQKAAQIIVGQTIKPSTVNAFKKIEIDRIAKNLVKPDGVQANIVDDIQRLLFKHVTTGISYEDASVEIVNLVQGVNGKQGLVERYSSQIARDSINRYNGTINNVLAAEFELDGFRYVGSLIETSREACNYLVEGSGPMEQFMRDGAYRIVDLPEIIEKLKNMSGWNPETTPTNFFELRGGFNCRHEAIPIKLTKRQLALWEDGEE
jgi:hypothetical protein